MPKRQWMFMVNSLAVIRHLPHREVRDRAQAIYTTWVNKRGVSPEFPSPEAAASWAQGILDATIPDPNL